MTATEVREFKCEYRGGCNSDAVFVCKLLMTNGCILRCEEHAKRQYFMSKQVEIRRIDDPDDVPAGPIQDMNEVPIEDFGKDHWSLLGYIEYRCANHDGILDGDHLRINTERHLRHPPKNHALSGAWNIDWGTRLKGFFLEGNKQDKTRLLPTHDDMDCLEDLEAAGMIVIHDIFEGQVELTELGKKYAGALKIFKENGGTFATFDYKKGIGRK